MRNKILALILGPAGIGLFAQLQSFQNLTANAVPMGMQVGALRYFAKYRATDRILLPTYVSTAGKVFLGLSILTATICLAFVKPLAGWVLDSRDLFWFLIPAIIGVPFLIQTQLWNTYLQAGLEMKTYSKVILTTSAVGLAMAVPLVYFWREAGAACHLMLVAMVGYAVVRLQIRRSMDPELRKDIRSARFNPNVLRALLRFGVANIPGFSIYLLVPFLVRTQIIRTLGFDANGIYQAVFAISVQYTSVPINALSTYALPKISQMENVAEINAEVNRNLKLALLINTPAIMLILLNSTLVVRLLFSQKFLLAVGLFAYQGIADFWKFVAYAIAAPMVPQERFRARNILCIAQYCVYLTVFYLALPIVGLRGVVIAEMSGWAFHFATLYLYLGRVNGYRFGRQNAWLFARCIIAVVFVAATFSLGPYWRLAGWGILILWLATALNREDRDRLIKQIKAFPARLSVEPETTSKRTA